MGSVMTRTAGAGLALCIGALCANGAYGQSPRGASGRLGEMLFEKGNSRKPATPPVARYEAEGGVAFVLDRSSGQTLMRFEGSNEIWALYPQAAPRGDIIYKNDVGEQVLRLSRLGGLTVFTATRPEGAAAALDGVGTTLRQAFADARRTGVLLQAASSKISTAVGRQIGIYADDFDGRSAGVAVDAANIVAEAVISLSKSRRNASALGRISDVVLVVGDKASATVNQRSLVITVVPGKGVSGRPSSAKIIQELKG
jgi:hypothetical protein